MHHHQLRVSAQHLHSVSAAIGDVSKALKSLKQPDHMRMRKKKRVASSAQAASKGKSSRTEWEDTQTLLGKLFHSNLIGDLKEGSSKIVMDKDLMRSTWPREQSWRVDANEYLTKWTDIYKKYCQRMTYVGGEDCDDAKMSSESKAKYDAIMNEIQEQFKYGKSAGELNGIDGRRELFAEVAALYEVCYLPHATPARIKFVWRIAAPYLLVMKERAKAQQQDLAVLL